MGKYDLKKRFKNKRESFFEAFTRRIATPFTWLAVRTPLTANMVTFISFILAMVACYFFQIGDYVSVALGGAIFYFAYILDLVDGDIARIKGLSSSFGAWFDEMTDTAKMSIAVFTIGIGVWRTSGKDLHLFLGALGAMNILFFNYCRQHILYRLTGGTKLEKEPEINMGKKYFIGFTAPTYYLLSFLPILGLNWIVAWFFATAGALPWMIKVRSAFRMKDIG